MKIDFKKLILFIVGTILIGGFFSFFIDSKGYFDTLIKPPLSPPAILFPIVWSVLFILMGISLYLVSESKSYDKDKSYLIYIIQLVVNSLWTLISFGLKWKLIAFLWIVLLIILVIIMIVNFYKVNKWAGLLQIPYFIWLLFASYLSLMIYILNR